ncbi:MAG: glycosyltransferase [Candidatus Scalindua rubra]|uniref:Glycosyltransferase n=1 Tax=Candidatus Scalindua rubra TaxID=1872076 RepID=A0A1E3X510_9BACT|nr:MAG: glycosyltransferase [Candidatus Scalindua rubra]
MNIAILLLNKGRGSGVAAKDQAEVLLGQNHTVFYIHPEVGDGVNGAHNIDIHLGKKTLPVHEYLPSAKEDQKAVSSMGYDEAMSYLPAYENALESNIQYIDIVIGHHANLTAIATANICKRYNKPYVLFLHGTGIEPRHQGLYDDKVWQLIQTAIEDANGIIVTTEYVRDHLVRNLIDIPLDRFLVLPCGVDLTEFNPGNTGSIIDKYDLSSKYVICPGALSTLKGPQNVVQASKYYSDLAPTIFIGDGELKEELEEELGDRGRFLGFVSDADKAQLINAATLLAAAPEKKEHFGIIYTEAIAGGVPVVAYEGGGVNSLVTEDTGVLTQRNPKALGEAVRSLLLDRKTHDSMAINCRKRAAELYSTDVLGPQLIRWLSGILNAY